MNLSGCCSVLHEVPYTNSLRGDLGTQIWAR